MKLLQTTAVLAFVLLPFTAPAQNYLGSKQGEWIAKDFRFHRRGDAGAAADAQSVKDLIAQAKVRPGELSFCSAGTGGAPHLAGELFKVQIRAQ